jgi:uncharacterized membrane protein YfcA
LQNIKILIIFEKRFSLIKLNPMNYSIADPNITISIALIFGVIIGIYGAALGIMGSLDYFYLNKSRFSILRITAISSILFSFTLTIIGIVSLAQKEYAYLGYVTALPGLLGLILFSLLFFVILKRNKFYTYHNEFY